MIQNRALQQYRQIGAQSAVTAADPHRLIQMLLEGALEKITVARGAIARNDITQKGVNIGEAIDIVSGLQASLNRERGAEIADNLDRLYDYIIGRLLEANLRNDVAILEEIACLLGEIKQGWEAISTMNTSIAVQEGGKAVSSSGINPR
ncbi:Flagellar protein FliS [Nitrosococcus oceani ATCC 19707]|uniref:Flagellar secretion chaperone FliS n=1 Tax=Nitrosococcus oceani (strain ATCC 19707 / BCRC 17464 / JCM 30415 / NCIMB 11848 / C-107) TaxID=323261 RepID=Q3J8M4_NITOC|nr:flagellar export chaperone FliS [Nitrosococcus oceani]ABA58822.1 Flagellar protein FliS [Nitrosococcus oceani ATCC 19707]GEM19087.1 flagellar protein FliS [Nitrosococcus oceani]